MHGVRLSRWSLAYFAVAIISLLVAEMLLVLGVADPMVAVTSGWTLVAVHLTTIGWASMLMLGALQQFVPVLTTKDLASQTASGITWATMTAGLLLLLLGFLALPGGAFAGGLWLLPVGGALIVSGVLVAIWNLGTTLHRAWPWELPVWFIATGLGFLLLTVSLGLTFAISLSDPYWLSPNLTVVLFGRGLVAHVVGGIAGWLTLTAMGVAYKLLSMFTLAPEHRGWWGRIAYLLTASGLLDIWINQWMGTAVTSAVGWILAAGGIIAYLMDMIRLYHARKRRSMELNAGMARGALVSLALLVAFGTWARVTHQWGRWALPLIFFGLYGWIGGLGLTQLYKIIPFLAWLESFGKKMGKQRTPRVQDLVNEPRDGPAYALYFIAVFVAAVALVFHWTWLFRGSMGLALVATADISRALWRVRHPRRSKREEASMASPRLDLRKEP